MSIEKLAQSNILETLKLTDASKEAQQEAMDDAIEVIFTSAMNRVKDGLSDDARAECERVFGEDHTEEQREQFLKKHVPNLEEILMQESLRYKSLAKIIASSSHD